MTPEGKVKKKVAAFLKKEDVWFFFPQSGGYGMSGVPDIICCAYGRFIAIECKADRTKVPTPLQEKAMKDITEHTGIVFLIHADNINVILASLSTLFAIWRSNG